MAALRSYPQPLLVAFLVAAVGWTMGSLELTQALMTTAGGRFETQSSSRANAFLVAFGLSKAASNIVAGWLADSAGRRPTMAIGWVAGAAVPPILYYARAWSIVVSTDVLLGINQAFCWATGIFVLMDLFGPNRRALAVGLLETVGYSTIALSRPIIAAVGGCSAETRENFALATALGLAVACGVLSLCCLRETKPLVRSGGAPSGGAVPGDTIGLATDDSAAVAPTTAQQRPAVTPPAPGSLRRRGDLRPRGAADASARRAIAAACLAGCVLNFGTAYAWGSMTRWLTARECAGGGCAASSGCGGSKGSGSLAANVLFGYSLLKGIGQLPAGAAADRRLVFGAGSWSYVVVGLGLIATSFAGLAVLAAVDEAALARHAASVGSSSLGAGEEEPGLSGGVIAASVVLTTLLGLGTALAYANLQACAAVLAPAERRNSAIGLVRCVRDSGYAVGGLVLGSATDLLQNPWVAPATGAAAAAIAAAVFEVARGHAAVAERAYGAGSASSVTGRAVGPIAAAGRGTELSVVGQAKGGWATAKTASGQSDAADVLDGGSKLATAVVVADGTGRSNGAVRL